MNFRIPVTALVCTALFSSIAAHAVTFKGLVERRAVNDPFVKKSQVVDVKIQNKVSKFVKSDERTKARPPKARRIRELHTVKVEASKIRTAAKASTPKAGE